MATVIAALLALFGLGRTVFFEARLDNAISECAAENEKMRNIFAQTERDKELAKFGAIRDERQTLSAQNGGVKAFDPDAFLAQGRSIDALECEAASIRMTRSNKAVTAPDTKNRFANVYAVQTRIVEFDAKHRRGGQDFYVSAISIFLIGLIPIGWYFLLARLAEVSAAFRGKSD